MKKKEIVCPYCYGIGKVILHTDYKVHDCEICSGTGKVEAYQ